MNSAKVRTGLDDEGQGNVRVSLGQYNKLVNKTLKKIHEERVVSRLWDKDYTIWKDVPDGIVNRLGWLTVPEKMKDEIEKIKNFAGDLVKDGFTHALLLGMGGSSLAAEVFRFTFGVKKGYLDLSVLDSTDPETVSMYSNELDFSKTAFIVSTKSGGTVETLSFAKYFYTRATEILGGKEAAGSRFLAITDPGSGLAQMAEKLGFRKTFLNDPDIGGRYSALSLFGLVPAALMGIDIGLINEKALAMASRCREEAPLGSGKNECAKLGAILGSFGSTGRDKLTLILSPTISSLGSWIEQLIAESTGKEGRGIVPVNGEALIYPEDYGKDRLFIYIRLDDEGRYDERVSEMASTGHPVVEIRIQDLYDLGAEFFRWEMATAVVGYVLNINPFDQPNVESSKRMTRQMLDSYKESGFLSIPSSSWDADGIKVYWDEKVTGLDEALIRFLSYAHKGDESGSGRSYVAIHAYLKSSKKTDVAIHALRTEIQRLTGMATTVGYGPRFLHSTGQLHKGDSGNGLFIQITEDIQNDENIPDSAGEKASSVSFGVLKMAQALGDAKALADAGRKVIRFHFECDAVTGIHQLTNAIP